MQIGKSPSVPAFIIIYLTNDISTESLCES